MRFGRFVQKTKKQVVFSKKFAFFEAKLSTCKSAVLCGILFYTPSYTHYPQEKGIIGESFLWKP